MAEPSIKGSIVGPMTEEILALRDQGKVSADEFETRLDVEALALLERKPDASSWVPLRVYEQFALFLQAFVGGSDAGYMRARGERAGARLVEAGIYQQLRFVEKTRRSTASLELFMSDMRLILSIQSALVNVGEWSIEEDPDHPDRALVVAREADAVPACLAEAMEGFFNGISQRGPHGHLRWTLERPSRDLIRMHMSCDVSTLG